MTNETILIFVVICFDSIYKRNYLFIIFQNVIHLFWIYKCLLIRAIDCQFPWNSDGYMEDRILCTNDAKTQHNSHTSKNNPIRMERAHATGSNNPTKDTRMKNRARIFFLFHYYIYTYILYYWTISLCLCSSFHAIPFVFFH